MLLWFFIYPCGVKFQAIKRTPVLLALAVLAGVCGLRLFQFDFCEQQEWKTYDLRAKAALRFPTPTATNLAFVAMEDSSIEAVNHDYHYKYPWPRFIYGRLVEELSTQRAQAVAFDILFGELNEFDPQIQLPNGSYTNSDDFFALQAHLAGNVLIAATPKILPPDLFDTNALAVGDVDTEKDSDGKLRRVKAFHLARHWHPLFRAAAADPEIQADLSQAQFKPGKIILPQTGSTNVFEVPVDDNNNFAMADLIGDKLPPGVPAHAKAFTDEPIWQMGIVLAAQNLKLDLKHAIIDLPDGRITLHGAHGVERVIPVDANGYFYVDWRLTPDDSHIFRAPIETLLRQGRDRLAGETNGLPNNFQGKLIVVGSAAQGNNLTDRGATPLEKDTLLVSTYWNVANSVLTGQFIHRTSLPVELGIICVLGLTVAFITWQLRARIIYASLTVFGLMLGYLGVTLYAYLVWGWWLPVFFPLVGAMLTEHGLLVVYLVMVEEREKRRVKSVFSKMLSPDVVNELLAAENFSMVGSRREVTVLFADIRGFTSLTDEMQENVVDYVRKNNLGPDTAEKCFDDSARETLETVNLYLTKVADAVLTHGGTLDKYIGDCVMAFWGAPLTNEQHALGCVRAALDAQRAIHDLNQGRLAENAARAAENQQRIAAGLPTKAPLRALQLGTGINTGTVIVGLMGSGEQKNYTAFGRDVNLASRLEGVSGSGRIIISETTHSHLQRLDPVLAATCVELPSVTVKGIRTAVRIFEVPWRPPAPG